MTSPETPAPNLQRLPSQIPGLDVILGGGFFRSGVYIVHGLPGCGKTILANQLCFGTVAAGGRAVYVTLLAESHARMLQHLRPMSFFDESAIPNRLSYISAFADLEASGLKGLMSVLRREMHQRKASVLILDGLVAAAETAESNSELKKFIHETQTNAIFNDCTVLLLTSGLPHRVSAEHTMVDGLLEIDDRLFDVRAERSLQVLKFRGGKTLRGKHSFQITDDGLKLFPRIEALFNQPPEAAPKTVGLSSGIAGFDQLLGDAGLPANSATVVVGSTGTGKTSIGLHFLSKSSVAEPGLYFGFFESPERVRASAQAFGLDFAALENQGFLHIVWHSQSEHLLDELAHRLLETIDAKGIKRLVVDGLAGFFEAAAYSERLGRFFACLTNELRRREVTVLMTLETRDAISSTVPMPYGVSGLVDNLIFLRFVEDHGDLKRLISIIKLRNSHFDPGVHAFSIGAGGVILNGRYTAGGDVIPSAAATVRTQAPAADPRTES